MTFTQEQAELHAFITGFLSDPMHDDKSANSMTTKVFRMALASLTAEPVGEVVLGEYDDSGCHPDARVVCIAADGQADWENFKDGTRLYATPPTPVVPKELLSAMEEVLRISDRDHDSWHKAKAGIVASRAAMLQGNRRDLSYPVDPQIAAYEKIMEQAIPDGYALVPLDMAPEMMRAVQLNSDLGGYAAANLSGAYSLFREFWDVAIAAAPQQEVK